MHSYLHFSRALNLKSAQKNAIWLKIFWYEVFVHWKLKLLNLLVVPVLITCLFLSKCFNFFIVTIKFIFKCLDPGQKIKKNKTNYNDVFYIRLYDLRAIRWIVDCLAKKLRGGGGRERGKVPWLSASSFLLPFSSPLSISRHPRLSGRLEKARWVVSQCYFL